MINDFSFVSLDNVADRNAQVVDAEIEWVPNAQRGQLLLPTETNRVVYP